MTQHHHYQVKYTKSLHVAYWRFGLLSYMHHIVHGRETISLLQSRDMYGLLASLFNAVVAAG